MWVPLTIQETYTDLHKSNRFQGQRTTMDTMSITQEQLMDLLARARRGEDPESLAAVASQPDEGRSITPPAVIGSDESGRKKYSLMGDDEQLNLEDTFILKAQMNQLAITNSSVVHQNQRKAANDIISEFTEDRTTLLVAALGKTQSGKTGVMYSLIQESTNVCVDGFVPVKNVFVITGLSSNEWKEQTKARLPQILRDNVFHRNELNKEFKKKISRKKNVLIIIDEIQIACKLKQSLHATFKELLTTEYLIENDIKIVEFSATPNGTFSDLSHWEGHAKTVKVHPGVGYIGHTELFTQGRMFQCLDLTIKENVEELYEKIKVTYHTPKYHIIRTKVGCGQDECFGVFKSVFGEGFDYLYHDSGNLESIDQFLDEGNERFEGAPKKHTFIFLKEMARCAKTFKKKFIGVWYERAIKGEFNDDVAIQGLAGRATGYDDNGESIVYTNLESIKRFHSLWEKDFSPEVPWKSNSTQYSKKKKTTISKKTFNAALNAKEDDFKKKKVNKKFCLIYDNGGEGFKNFKDLQKEMMDKYGTRITDGSIHKSEGGYHISCKAAGSVALTENSDNRLLMNTRKFKNLVDETRRTNVTNVRDWVVYPAYKDGTSAPEDVRWFGKVRVIKE